MLAGIVAMMAAVVTGMVVIAGLVAATAARGGIAGHTPIDGLITGDIVGIHGSAALEQLAHDDLEAIAPVVRIGAVNNVDVDAAIALDIGAV